MYFPSYITVSTKPIGVQWNLFVSNDVHLVNDSIIYYNSTYVPAKSKP